MYINMYIYAAQEFMPPETPRTEVLRDDSYGYSINNLSKLHLLTFLVEMS